MNKQTKWIFMGILTLSMAMPIAQAKHGGDDYDHGSCGMKDELESKFYFKTHFLLDHADELGLSEKQVEDIENIKMDAKKSLVRQDTEIEILKMDVKQHMHRPSMDMDAINKLIDQKYDLKKAKAKYLVESIAKVKGVLSEDQHAKMKAMKKDKKH